MGLTKQGIVVQILSSLRARKEHEALCTTNDCKVVVNHLVRKYSEPLTREGGQQRRKSRAVAAGETDDTVDDHAIPVIVLVEELLDFDNKQVAVNETNLRRVEALLDDSILLVEITRGEDAQLAANGYQQRMPEGWRVQGHPYHRDPLARYRAAGIEIHT